jgi:hypothetical protein
MEFNGNSLSSSSSTVAVYQSSYRVANLLRQTEENPFVRRSLTETASYTRHQDSSRSDNSHRSNVEWVLPTDRKEYIKNHDSTKLAKLHANKDHGVAPLWTKVSKTPW